MSNDGLSGMIVDVQLTYEEIKFLLDAVKRGCLCDRCTRIYYSLLEKLEYIDAQFNENFLAEQAESA